MFIYFKKYVEYLKLIIITCLCKLKLNWWLITVKFIWLTWLSYDRHGKNIKKDIIIRFVNSRLFKNKGNINIIINKLDEYIICRKFNMCSMLIVIISLIKWYLNTM